MSDCPTGPTNFDSTDLGCNFQGLISGIMHLALIWDRAILGSIFSEPGRMSGELMS